jgi:hypothetical protein
VVASKNHHLLQRDLRQVQIGAEIDRLHVRAVGAGDDSPAVTPTRWRF